MKEIVSVECQKGYQLQLSFDDGKEGTIDVSKSVPFKGVFEPLQDTNFFQQVFLNSESGTIEWPNGADLDPDVLHKLITGDPIPSERN